MSAAWYPDPDDPALLRWWDGTQWTEHRHSPTQAPAADEVIVRVRIREDDGRSELVATPDRVLIGGETFALAEMDSVQWTAVRSHLNGSYMGTLFRLRVRAADRKKDFAMDTGSGNKRLDEFSEAYHRVVGLLDTVVCPRLAQDMATLLQAGQTITLGPAGARVELTSEGFRLKKPWSKLVPWHRVAGTEMQGGNVFFLVRKGDSDESRRHSMVPLDGENIVVLPHLASMMSPTAGGRPEPGDLASGDR